MFDFVEDPNGGDDDNQQQQQSSRSPPLPDLTLTAGHELHDSGGEFEMPDFAPGDEVPEMISFPCQEESERPPRVAAPSADDYPLGCVAGLVDLQLAIENQTEDLWDPAHDLIWSMPGRKEVTVVRHSGEYSLVKASVQGGAVVVQASVYRACLKDVIFRMRPYLELNVEEAVAPGSAIPGSSNGAGGALTSSNTLGVTLTKEAQRQFKKATASGNKAFKEKDYARAVLHYTDAIGLSGISKDDLCRATANRAAAYLAQGDKESSLNDAIKCVNLDPRDVTGYCRAGNVYRKMKDYKNAESYYSRALKLSPNNTDVRLILESNKACAHFKSLRHNSIDVLMLGRNKFETRVRGNHCVGRTVWDEFPHISVGWPESNQCSARGEDKVCSHCLKILNERELAMESVRSEGAKEFVAKHYNEAPTSASSALTSGIVGVGSRSRGSSLVAGGASTSMLPSPSMPATNLSMFAAASYGSVPGGFTSSTGSRAGGGGHLDTGFTSSTNSQAGTYTPYTVITCERGCGATFCSQACHDEAWDEYHCMECSEGGKWAKGMTKLNYYLKNAPFAGGPIGALLFLTIRYLSKIVVSKEPHETIKEVAEKTVYLPSQSSADRGRDESAQLEMMILSPCFEQLCQGLSTTEATAINFLVFKRIFFHMKSAAVGFRVSNWCHFRSKVEHHLDVVHSGLGRDSSLPSGQSSGRDSAARQQSISPNQHAQPPQQSAQQSYSSFTSSEDAAAARLREGLEELHSHPGLYSRCVGIFPVASCCVRGEVASSGILAGGTTGVLPHCCIKDTTAPCSPTQAPRKETAANVTMRCPPNALGPIQLKSIAPIPKGGQAVLRACYEL